MRAEKVGRISCFLAAAALGVAGCERYGFSDRVLWRLPSADGRMVAVCQEVPQFDGPNYALRLERPDGSLLRTLLDMGDGDPCSEIAWSPDGRTLAVLSNHVARIRVVEVEAAMHERSDARSSPSAQFDFSGERQFTFAKGLRFVSPSVVELQLCPYSLAARQRTGKFECTAPPVPRRVTVLPHCCHLAL
jgi:hypothetical protein